MSDFTQTPWIRRESKSRPNQFYFFNTKTGESRWEKQTASPSTSASACIDSALEKGSDVKQAKTVSSAVAPCAMHSKEKEKNVSSKSRGVKKSRAPALERLKAIMTGKKEISARLKEEIGAIHQEKMTGGGVRIAKNTPKSKKSVQERLESIPKKIDVIAVPKTTAQCENSSAKKVPNMGCVASGAKQTDIKNKQSRLNVSTVKQNRITKTKHSTHKTPAQQRLVKLQQELVKEQLISKNKNNNSTESNEIRQGPVVTQRSEQTHSTDSTDSVADTGLIDGDIKLPLARNSAANTEKTEAIDGEEMDWEPSMVLDPPTDVIVKCSTGTIDSSPMHRADEVLVVPDTNIFLSSLVCIKDIIAKEPNYRIIVPYMVLQELDKLKCKKNETVSQMATRAIHYIYENMKDDHQSRFTGQSAVDDCRHLIEIQCPDDKVLNCCLQLKELQSQVTLLTNDKNLSVKAKVNNVDILTSRNCNEKYDNDDR